jgi:hypothetical protein
MKRAILVTLSVIAVCSLCFAGSVSAFKAGYTLGNYQGTEITANGAVGAGEWIDSFHDWLYDDWTKKTDTFSLKFEMGGTPNIADQWLIEVLSDTTNDAGDVFTFCFCGATDNAATPQVADDVLINHTHSATTIYRGTGTGWAPDAAIVIGTNVFIASSIAASPTSATPHWIIELKFDKTGAIAGTAFQSHVRLAVYDANTGKTLMWPPMSQKDVPSSWGLNDYSSFAGQSIPEGLTIGVMVALSSVAVIVSTRYFRKQTKIKRYSSVKL